MSASFDWEFEEDRGSPRLPDERGPGSKRRRGWLRLGAVLLILLAVAALAIHAWVVNRQRVIKTAEAEVRAAVELEMRAIANSDAELFRSRQDPTDPSWQKRQVARFFSPAAGDIAPSPGLARADRPAEIKRVHVRGRTGRVELTRWYFSATYFSKDADAQPLPFQITWFYRQFEEGSWYHIAPPKDYLGSAYSWHGSRLVIRASGAEAKLVDAVASDLDRLVAEGCRWLHCRENMRYRLDFREDIFPFQLYGDWWALPALYITGLPENDAARAAWLNGLKRWLVEALAQVYHGHGGGRIVCQLLMSHLYAELGLAEPPSPGVELLTKAVSEGRQHRLQALWEALYDPGDPEGMRLLEAEVATLLAFMKELVGPERLFELLPALYPLRLDRPFDSVLEMVYGIDPDAFKVAWADRLSELTGLVVAAESPAATDILPDDRPLEPTPSPSPPAKPGDQIAMICDHRIWVGDVDGSNLVPLTSRIQSFNHIRWSPDGRSLLATGYPSLAGPWRALYILAADGSESHYLMSDPAAELMPLGWTPDGREAIYFYRPVEAPGSRSSSEFRAVNLDTGETRQLKGLPAWSPNGEHLLFVTGIPGSAWLADADWGNARQIVDQAWMWPETAWSPGSSKVALVLGDSNATPNAVAIYDLASESLNTLITPDDLVALRPLEGYSETDGAVLASLADKPPESLLPFGWSIDARHLLVAAQWTPGNGATTSTALLAVIPLDGSEPQMLSHTTEGSVGDAAWSPIDPDRLAFTWQVQRRQTETLSGFLIDLSAGRIYATTQSPHASWSPDGAWLAFARQHQVIIVDQDGQEQFTLEPFTSCSNLAWNPTADLSGLQDSTDGLPGR